ncbi:unnamed protein product [Durusdinium trenchii]|uniref:Uncharacterized protein n=1 Tax=Durusdinium trenchii TaxID=1381693 RepID=A0ABP0PJ95_9DINO
MTALCLLWKWHRWFGITLIGFLGMLHPAEFVHLVRADLLLPSDTLVDSDSFNVHIRHPNTARFARKQHCKIDDPIVLQFIIKVFARFKSAEQLFPGGPSTVGGGM